MSRPHFLPEVIWMGVVVGQWPIEAFPSEEKAKQWASDAPWKGDHYEERRIWSVAIPADTVIYTIEKIPATTKMVQVTS